MKNVENIQAPNTWLANEALFNTNISTEPFKVKNLKDVMMGLRNSWLNHTHKACPRCKTYIKKERAGKNKRVSYFCHNCQLLFKK